MEPALTGRAAVAQMSAVHMFDRCVESREEWSMCLLATERQPECQALAATLLYTVAIITITVEADLTIHLDSNIPEILRCGQGVRVRYLVVHTKYRPTDGTICHAYWALAGIIARFTGIPEVPAPGLELGSLPVSLAAMLETALMSMPNLQGVLVARIGDLCCLVADTGPRYISYCAGVFVAGQLAVPAVVESREDAMPASVADQPGHLPLSVSALDYLCRRPLPFSALTQLSNATLANPWPCTHVPLGPAPGHIRRHVFVYPGLTFMRGGRGGVQAYDWCRLVLTQDLP